MAFEWGAACYEMQKQGILADWGLMPNAEFSPILRQYHVHECGLEQVIL